MKLRAKAIQGAKWSSIQQLFGKLVEFSVIVVIARILGPNEFGLVALAAVVVALITPLVIQGLGTAIVQKDKIEDEHLNSVFWVNFGIGIMLFILISITSSFWALFFSQPLLEPVLVWLSFSFVLTSLRTVQEAIVRREFRFKELAIRTLIAKILSGAVGVGMAINGFGVWSLVGRQLVNSAISMVLLWRISYWRPKLHFSKAHYLELFPFGIKVLANEMLVFVNRRSANLIIGFFMGPTALGFYNMANRFMNLLLQIVSKAVYQVGVPAFAKIQHSQSRVKNGIYEVIEIIGLVSIPVFIGVLFLAPEIVKVLLGEKWLPAIPVFQILMLIGIIQSLLSPLVTALVGIGQPGVRLKLQIIDAVANLLAFFIAVSWGIVAVALAYVIVGYCMVPLWFAAIKRFVPVTSGSVIKILIAPTVSSLFMIVWITTAADQLVSSLDLKLSLIFTIITGALVYSFFIIIFFKDSANRVISICKQVLAGRSE